jgi:hypothetical protein
MSGISGSRFIPFLNIFNIPLKINVLKNINSENIKNNVLKNPLFGKN